MEETIKGVTLKPNLIGNHSKIKKRHRRKCNYKKINNQMRQKLIEMVYLNDYLLKDAAKFLGINYSTAKTILRIFRIEKRIEKKNADEERELKQIIYQFQKTKNTQEESTEKKEVNKNMAESPIKEIKKIKDVSDQIIKGRFEDDKNSSSSYSTKNCCNDRKAYQMINVTIEKLCSQINESSATLSNCYRQIESNQMMINYIMSSINTMKSSLWYSVKESLEKVNKFNGSRDDFCIYSFFNDKNFVNNKNYVNGERLNKTNIESYFDNSFKMNQYLKDNS